MVVDPDAYAQLVDSTPLPDVAGLAGLGDRALVTPDVGGDGTVLLDGQAVPFTVGGTLPPGPTTVLLPVTAVPADLAAPDVLWLTGPGAAAAASTVPGGAVELRADRLAAVADAPLPRGLAVLGVVAAGVLLGLTVLAVVLGGVAGARRRRGTSGVLRTLGLGERQARAVTLLELLPPGCWPPPSPGRCWGGRDRAGVGPVGAAPAHRAGGRPGARRPVVAAGPAGAAAARGRGDRAGRGPGPPTGAAGHRAARDLTCPGPVYIARAASPPSTGSSTPVT